MFKDDMIIVAEAEESSKPDHLGGFFASVVLALLVCTFGVSAIRWGMSLFDISLSVQLGYDLTAALFVALLMADPIGTYLNKTQARRSLSRFAFGFVFGGLLQHFVVTPIAGGGVSMFIFLTLSLVLLPMMVAMNAVERALERRGIEVGEEVSRSFVRLLRLPRAVPVALAVVLVFQILWWIAPGPITTLSLMGVALLLAIVPTLTVPILDPEDDAPAAEAKGPAFTRYSALALHEAFLFFKWHLGTVVYFTSVGWFVNGLLPFVPDWQRALSFVEGVVRHGLLAKASLSLLMLLLALGVGMLVGKILMALLGKILRWPAGDAELRFGMVRNTLLLRS